MPPPIGDHESIVGFLTMEIAIEARKLGFVLVGAIASTCDRANYRVRFAVGNKGHRRK